MRSKLSAIACSVALSACACAVPPSPPALDVKTITASVPVPVPCVDKVPDAPQLLSDKNLMTGSGQQVIDQLWRDHLLQRDYIGELTPLVLGCSKIPAAGPLTGSAF